MFELKCKKKIKFEELQTLAELEADTRKRKKDQNIGQKVKKEEFKKSNRLTYISLLMQEPELTPVTAITAPSQVPYIPNWKEKYEELYMEEKKKQEAIYCERQFNEKLERTRMTEPQKRDDDPMDEECFCLKCVFKILLVCCAECLD